MKYDTSTPVPKDPNDTSYDNPFGNTPEGLMVAKPIPVSEPYFNRDCRRYAKKHGLTLEEAFKRLYK